MEKYVKRMINEFPIKMININTDLNPDENTIFGKLTEKVWVKKKLNGSILNYQE